MRAPMNKAVVVSLGIVSPLGIGQTQTWQNILKQIYPETYKIPLTTPENEDRSYSLAKLALSEALENIPSELIKNAGMLISNSKYGLDYFERTIKTHSPKNLPEEFLDNFLPDRIGLKLARKYKIEGPVKNYAAACTTGLLSLIEGAKLIESGEVNLAITGATESAQIPVIKQGFESLGVLTTEKIRPFSLNRSGFQISEGCGVIVLADYNYAKKHNLPILAEISSYFINNQAFHLTSFEPNGDSIAFNIHKNLEKTNINKVSFINCHGTATKQNDLIETKAFKKAFGKMAYNIPISATKPLTGHSLGATSAIEFILSILSLYNNTLIPTINLDIPDPECDLDYVPSLRKNTMHSFMSINYGFGGHVMSIIASKEINPL